MASLYKRPNSTHWWAKFRVGGQVVRVSTGTSKKRKAQDFLDVHAGSRGGRAAPGEAGPHHVRRAARGSLRVL
jgi:hypothetical protein